MPGRELDPVTRLTTDALGEPGRRTFFLQAASGSDQVTVVLEKEQVRGLAERLDAWLPRLADERPEDPEHVAAAAVAALELVEPLEPAFRVGQLTLTYDPARDLVALVATELIVESDDEAEPTDADEIRMWVTRPQLRQFARQAGEVVARGRPTCPLCGNPLDPSGHICPAQNGHGRLAT